MGGSCVASERAAGDPPTLVTPSRHPSSNVGRRPSSSNDGAPAQSPQRKGAATRRPSTTPVARPVSTLMIEDVQREKARDKLEAQGKRPGWDVGERPSRTMAFIEYPLGSLATAYPLVVHRDENNVTFKRGSQREERETRAARSASAGWAAEQIRPYTPLGELSSALDPEATKPEAYTKARNNCVRVVWPEGDRLAMRRGEPEPTYEMTLLRSGVTVGPHTVAKNAHSYYCIDKPASKVLRICLEALSGDPDLYVCNECRTPTHDTHTWRATAIGEDVIEIQPTHPSAKPGRYFISVYGTSDATYHIHAQLLNPVVCLPPETKDARSQSWRAVKQEIRAGSQRSAAVRAGASLFSTIEAQMVSAGHEPAVVRAAATPIIQRIDEFSRKDLRRSRSPSPQRDSRSLSPKLATSSGLTPNRPESPPIRPGTAGLLRPHSRPGTALIETIKEMNGERRRRAEAAKEKESEEEGLSTVSTEPASAPSPYSLAPAPAEILLIESPPPSPMRGSRLGWGRAAEETATVSTADQVADAAASMLLERRTACHSNSSSMLEARVVVAMRGSSSTPILRKRGATMHHTPMRNDYVIGGRLSKHSGAAEAQAARPRSTAAPASQASCPSAPMAPTESNEVCARPLPQRPSPPSRSRASHNGRLQFDWQPPNGVLWSALPPETRPRLAKSQYAEAKQSLDRRLKEQLQAAAVRRPLEYQWRMQLVSRVEPASPLFRSSTLRQGAKAIEAEYAGAARAMDAIGGHHGEDERALHSSVSAPMLHSQRAAQYLADTKNIHRDGTGGRMNAATYLERNLKPTILDDKPVEAPAAPLPSSSPTARRGVKDTKTGKGAAAKAEAKPRLRTSARSASLLRHLELDLNSAHKTVPEQLADALARSGESILELFREWDENASGTIDREEFFTALRTLGFKGTQDDMQCVFDMFDGDASGFVAYDELAKHLRARTLTNVS